jgi:hypothetical protein
MFDHPAEERFYCRCMVNLRSASLSDDSRVAVIISHVPVEGIARCGKFTFYTTLFCAKAGYSCACIM